MVERFCSQKEAPCVLVEFSQLLGGGVSFELNDITSLSDEELTACSECPVPIMGKVAIAYKNLAESGELAEILDTFDKE